LKRRRKKKKRNKMKKSKKKKMLFKRRKLKNWKFLLLNRLKKKFNCAKPRGKDAFL
jgi:hypothetical protein